MYFITKISFFMTKFSNSNNKLVGFPIFEKKLLLLTEVIDKVKCTYSVFKENSKYEKGSY